MSRGARSQSLVLIAPEQMEWVERDLPPIGERDVLVETRSGAMSIGTELPLYRGVARSSAPARYPRMTGYESVGIVVARGAAVHHVREGDRVVSTYGHQTRAVVPASRAAVVPPDVDDELAVLLVLSGDVATGARRLGAALREAVLVTGAGEIGLLAIWVLLRLGVPAVDVVEPRAGRRDLAWRLGARLAVPPDAASDLAPAYAGGVECSARDAAFALLQERMRRGGRICVLSDGNVEPLTLAPAFHEQQLTVVGSSDCPDYRAHADWYFDVLRGGEHALAQLFDQHVTAGELPGAFAALADGSLTAIKVFVRYGAG